MSLIDDALRRAEAARAPSPGSPGFRVPMPLPDPGRARRRRFRRLAAGGAIAVVVLAAGFLLVRGAGRRGGGVGVPARPTPARIAAAVPEASPSPAATPIPSRPPGRSPARSGVSASAPPRTAGPSASGSPLAAAPSPRPPAGASPMPATSAAAGRPTLPPPTPPRAIVRLEPPVTPIVLPPAEISEASGSPRVRASSPPGSARKEPTPRSFTGTANLPSGKLQLDGIVYSDGGATALINGRVVSPGSYVEGFTVVTIEATRVELKDENGATIFLTLR